MPQNKPEHTQKNQQQGARPLEDQDEQKLKFESEQALIEDDEARKRNEASTAGM